MATEHHGHLVFSCGGSHYALPAELSSEVVGLPALTAVPGGPRHLLGVFAHRGEVLPVIDLSLLLGGAAGAYKRAVVLRLTRGVVALAATRVHGVMDVGGAREPLGAQGVQACLLGPGTCGVGDTALVDVEPFFDLLSRGG